MKNLLLLIHPAAIQPPAERPDEAWDWLSLADEGTVTFPDPCDAHEIRMQLLASLGALSGSTIILTGEHNSPRLRDLHLRSEDLRGSLLDAFNGEISSRGPAPIDDRLDNVTELLMANRTAEDRPRLRGETRVICIDPELDTEGDDGARRHARHRLSVLASEVHLIAPGPLALSEAECWQIATAAKLRGWSPREIRRVPKRDVEDF